MWAVEIWDGPKWSNFYVNHEKMRWFELTKFVTHEMVLNETDLIEVYMSHERAYKKQMYLSVGL